jgi:cation:H+ antiporter
MKSPSDKPRVGVAVCALLLLAALPIREVGPWAMLWTAPSILLAAMLIAWAAESAQFFIAQGFALAILAWLQTLPEFAVEAVYALRQDVPMLLAGLTGALRLLTGLGWPLIYATAALAHRRRYAKPLRAIHLSDEHCVEVVGLLVCMAYAAVIWWKASLNLFDAAVLIAIYVAYLWLLSKQPPQHHEGIQDLERIPRSIVLAAKPIRVAAITGMFVAGGAVIYFISEPFLDSLQAVSIILGVEQFVFVQWVVPFVSEFPEGISAFNWARTIERASMALMNLVSSNINQWTLLAAMLPIFYSLSRGAASVISFDNQQQVELLMTLGQSLVGALFLINMELAWWEAAALFVLWAIQFALSPVKPGPGIIGTLATGIHWHVTIAYLGWAGIEIVRLVLGRRKPAAFQLFGVMWRTHMKTAR